MARSSRYTYAIGDKIAERISEGENIIQNRRGRGHARKRSIRLENGADTRVLIVQRKQAALTKAGIIFSNADALGVTLRSPQS